MNELINGELYFINENGHSPIFNSYDVVRLLDVMVAEPLALVELVEPFGIGENQPVMGTTVLVPIYLLTRYETKDPEPEPVPDPEPIDPEPDPEHVEPSPEPEEPLDPNIEPPKEVEPEPVLPNVDDESEEQE